MEFLEARDIVRSLIDGVHPVTGENFEQEAPYNDPAVIRALLRVFECSAQPKRKRSLEERQKDNLDKGMPKNSGLPWTEEGREGVASGFKAGRRIEEIALDYERSGMAIVAELKRQGVISPEEAVKLGLIERNPG